MARLSMFFGGLALLLARSGLYGVTSYAVNRRRTEIGIRMALGADPSGVVLFVLRRVATLVAIGVVAGAALSLWASRFIATLLYGLAAARSDDVHRRGRRADGDRTARRMDSGAPCGAH